MTAVREFHEAGDDVELIFDGAGTRWPGELSDPGHQAHGLTRRSGTPSQGRAATAPRPFEATEDVENAGVALLDEYERHPSFRNLLQDGYEVLTLEPAGEHLGDADAAMSDAITSPTSAVASRRTTRS